MTLVTTASAPAAGREFAAVARFAAARRAAALPTGLDTVVRRVADQVAGLPVLRQHHTAGEHPRRWPRRVVGAI